MKRRSVLLGLLIFLGLHSVGANNSGSLPADLFLPQEPPPTRAEREFDTDFTCHTIPYSEVLSGGPPKDGIPAIDDPSYVSRREADTWLEGNEPVIVVQYRGNTRVYPLQILMWHEIVNDVLGGKPITVTYCPLCNTGIAFDRQLKDQVFDFGTTGRLRYSNLIMYDRQTETWWQQATGKGIAGAWAGYGLTLIPTLTMSWAQAKEEFSRIDVLSKNTGFSRPYGQNPYVGYDNPSSTPFLFRGPQPGEGLRALERVMTLHVNDESATYANARLMRERVVLDTVGGRTLAVLWEGGTSSALDTATIPDGRDVGSANAFYVPADGPGAGMAFRNGAIIDKRGNTWNATGRAVSGPDKGTRLDPVISVQHFWFSASAFHSSESLRDGGTLF